MTNLLVIKEHLKNIYGKYEAYLFPLIKFFLALISLTLINNKLGYMGKLDNMGAVLVASLMCSFLPTNFTVVIAALFILLHTYALSLECAAVMLAVIMIMFLLYFRFSPKETVAVILTPVCFFLKVPYVMPLSMGLVGSPASAVSVGCGIVMYYAVEYINVNATTLGAGDADNAIAKFRMVIDGLVNNKAMLVTLVAFTITVILVYFIRRLSVDYAWTIAIVTGIVVNVAAMFIGDLALDINLSILGAVFGGIVSALIVKVLQFFVFNLDYTRTEVVQFEDDEYYYYVKAVPKISMATPEKSVKRINPQKKKVQDEARRTAPRPAGSPIDRAIDRNVEKTRTQR